MNKWLFNTLDYVLEGVAYLFLLAGIALAIYGVKVLPPVIPTHYDFHGNVDGYGSPYTLLILPIIMLITVAMMSLMLHFCPMKFWNVPFKICTENARGVYHQIVLMVLWMNLEIGIFTFWGTLEEVLGKTSLNAAIFLIISMFFTVGLHTWLAWKANKR